MSESCQLHRHGRNEQQGPDDDQHKDKFPNKADPFARSDVKARYAVFLMLRGPRKDDGSYAPYLHVVVLPQICRTIIPG